MRLQRAGFKPEQAVSLMLAKQNAIVTLKGLSTKGPGTIAAPGQLEIAENVLARKGEAGNFEFSRRNGMTQIATTVSGTGARLASYLNSVISQNSAVLFPYSNTVGDFVTAVSSLAPPIQIGARKIITPLTQAAGANTPTQTSIDIAYIGNTACYVWINESGWVQVTLYDTASDVQFPAGPFTFSGATNCKVVALGTSFFVFWKEANDIKGRSISSLSPFTISSTVAVVASGSALAGTDYDIQVGFDGTHIALMYRASAANHVRCLVDTSFTVGTSITDSTAADQPDVGMCWFTQKAFTGNLFYATINAANGLKIQTISSTTLVNSATLSNATVTAGLNFTGAVGVVSAADPKLIYEVTGATSMEHQVKIADNAGVSPVAFSVGLASRAFFVSGRATVLTLYNSQANALAPQDTYLVLDVMTASYGTNIGKYFYGRAWRHTASHLSSVVVDSAGVFHMIGQNVVEVLSATGGAIAIQYTPVDMTLFTASPTLGPALSLGGTLLIPGAQISEFDGVSFATGVHEQGMHVNPEPLVLVEGAAASGNMPPGTRSYIAVYRWTDRNGNSYESAPSTPVSITTVNANSSVTATSHCYPGNNNRFFVQIEMYCTPNNGDGTQYFRVTPPTYNGVSANMTQAFISTASEATLAAGEPFVPSSAGGELENIGAPAMNVICEHKNRVFGILAEEPHRIGFSKEYVVGNSIGFFDGFIINTPQATGPIYGLASMDGHLLAIKRDIIYVISGDYPDADGKGPAIPLPTVLPVAVGTQDPRSVVVTSMGVMFYSRTKGFWLLNRSLQAIYIGAQVEALANNNGMIVSGACVMSDQTQVRWTTEGGTSFILDTYFAELGTPVWTTFTGQPCVHSINHLGRWYQLTSGGALKVENSVWRDGSQQGEQGTFTNGAEYFAKVKISDINFGGILGFLRCWRGQLLGEWRAGHKLKITISDNHRSVAGQNFTYDATTDPDPYMMEFRPTVQKRTAMDVTVEEVTTGAQQTQGGIWTAIGFNLGVKPGLSRMPQARTMVGS